MVSEGMLINYVIIFVHVDLELLAENSLLI